MGLCIVKELREYGIVRGEGCWFFGCFLEVWEGVIGFVYDFLERVLEGLMGVGFGVCVLGISLLFVRWGVRFWEFVFLFIKM